MRLGIALSPSDPWHFFNDVFDDLKQYYQVDIFEFKPVKLPFFHDRTNNLLFHKKLGALLRENDVVFFEWATELLAAATHYPKKSKIVTRLHRYEMFGWLQKINWNHVDKIILVSQAMCRKFSEAFPEQADKTVVIPVGISLKKFQPTHREFMGEIGTLCHLTPRKRVYELILAFSELLQYRNNLRLHIAGGHEQKNNDYFDALQNLVYRLGIDDRVIFYGQINEPWEWYTNIDIFISNSYSEGLQVAPMEAMASGCYCLSHYWEGANELLPEENLFFTEKQLINKIQEYCEFSESNKMIEKKRMRAIASKNFDIDLIKGNIRNVIEDLGKISNS